MLSLENIFQIIIKKKKKRKEIFFTPASGHGNLNKFTAPLSSPVAIVDDVA